VARIRSSVLLPEPGDIWQYHVKAKSMPGAGRSRRPARTISIVRTHPYAEAVYEVIPLANGNFGVKVSTSVASPAIVSSFDTAASAAAWIAAHKGRVQNQSQTGTVFRRPYKSTATGG
jgi:hypothetical protein